MTVPPHSLDAEQNVLGAVLISPAGMPGLVVDEGLRGNHFYRATHGRIWQAMLTLYDGDEPIDPTTVVEQMARHGHKGDEDYIHSLPTGVGLASSAGAYGRRVVELAELRAKGSAFMAGLEAVNREDRGAIAEAETALSEAVIERSQESTPEALAHELFEHLQRGKVETFPLPFDKLNRCLAGGLRRGEVTLIGGWSSHGKSAFLDQTLQSIAKHTRSLHLYINEMTPLARGLRFVASKTEVEFRHLMAADLPEGAAAKVMPALDGLPYGITNAAGWTAEQIAFDIRRRRWAVAAVDILHRIEFEDESDLRRISRVLNDAALRANCAIIATVHLNERRVQHAKRPRPTTGDIHGSGMLKSDAANVLFVHRDQSEDGVTVKPESSVYIAKARNGELGGVETRFRGGRMRFELA